MNEQELKNAFHDVVASSPPPSMDPSRALGTARKARSKRRASLAGAAVAVLVVGIGIGSAVPFHRGTGDVLVMGSSSSAPSSTPSSAPPSPFKVQTGRIDRAPDDPDATFSEKLMVKVQRFAQVAGYEAGPLEFDMGEGRKGQMLHNLSLIEGDGSDQSRWLEHRTGVPIRKDGRLGDLTAGMYRAKPQQDLCGLVNAGPDVCQVTEINGKRVAVHTRPELHGGILSVIYQAPNGDWGLFSASRGHSTGSPFDAIPFNARELAALVTDPSFFP